MGPENRLKNTFYAYLDYFNLDKRVIYHLSKEDPFFSTKSECQIVYYNLDKSKILSVLDGGEVNFSKSNKNKIHVLYMLLKMNWKIILLKLLLSIVQMIKKYQL